MLAPPIKYFLDFSRVNDVYIPLFYQRTRESVNNEVIILCDTKYEASHYILIDLYMTNVFFRDKLAFGEIENYSKDELNPPHGVHMISRKHPLINMTDQSYIGIQEQISYIETHLLTGTFQERDKVYCNFISAIILPSYSCDVKMLIELFPFVYDKEEDEHRLELHMSDLVTIDEKEVTVRLLNTPNFDNFDDYEEGDSEESDVSITMIITGKALRIQVFGNRSDFMDANMALLRVISRLLDTKKSIGTHDSFS